MTAFVYGDPDGLALAESIAGDWSALGVTGHFLARNLDTGEQLGFDVDVPVPLASVIKVPIALAVLDLIAEGALDPARPVTVDPATRSLGATGISAFRYPVTIAVADLVQQMLTVSDNAAADALLDLVGMQTVQRRLRRWGCREIRLRHRLQRMYECAVGAAGENFGLALELAIQDDERGAGHSIETLDPARANVATAAALVDFLHRVWRDDIAQPDATARLRDLMSQQVFTHRLAGDLRADTIRISAKTGSFLHLRHEIGVIESGGCRIAVAALTRSDRRAGVAQDIDLSIGAAARSAFEHLR